MATSAEARTFLVSEADSGGSCNNAGEETSGASSCEDSHPRPEKSGKALQNTHRIAVSDNGSSQWTLYHVLVFALTFVSFMLVHSGRKAFSNVKSLLEKEWTTLGNCEQDLPNTVVSQNLYCHVEPASTWAKPALFHSNADAELFMGSLDTIFMFFYAVGLYVNGFLGDRLPLVWVLSTGMCVSSLVTFVFGCVTEWGSYQQRWFYGCLWAMNGLAQSACWPSIVAIMANWFGKKGRGFVFGLWSANASAGNVLGALVVSAVLDFGYDTAFLVPSVMLFAGSIINIFCLPESPQKVQALQRKSNALQNKPIPLRDRIIHATSVDEQSSDTDTESVTSGLSPARSDKAISFFAAWKIPGVLEYSLAYACLKLVNYSLFFWLPFYLTDSLHWSRTLASKLSTLYDIGAIVGGTLGGITSDLIGHRSPVLSLMLIIAVPFLFIYRQYGTGVMGNSVLMFALGFWISGPANLLSSAISVDLAQQKTLKGNTKALATVAGIIDGTGSAGAAVGQYLISLIETQSGWQNVIYFLMSMLIMATLCMCRMLVHDCRSMWRTYGRRHRGL
ncbi:sugar phosphate exchanger 3-like [Sycon ciliatum]|uniref:sugar phosphate exchanger 3-like n=1 Tax=Sycon ciliatum TaxID=27933 RepID=UPI0020AE2CB0|eukprot:scpid44920/ scgid26238/ Sugar phosphate exchanger 3; Solute carrier family 37 member 3